MQKVDARQAALTLLYSIEERGERRGKELSRARLSQVTLKRLWNRESLGETWLAEVNDWLLSAGWTLFYAGTTFGIVKTSVVEDWPRIASKRIQGMLDQVAAGQFNFSALERFFELDRSKAAKSSFAPPKKRRTLKISRGNKL
jgi:hypothetical protein